METKKAKFLDKYLLTCIQAFKDVSAQGPIENYEIDGKLVNFKGSDFENHYNDFIKELEVVILETTDITTTIDYIETCLFGIIYWDGFHTNQNKMIFALGYEEDFLITLKRNIDKYSNLIKGLCEMDNRGNQVGIYEIFDSTIETKHLSKDGNTLGLTSTLAVENKPVLDIRFDFENMQAECDELNNTQEMILFIHDRLNYFKQWQLLYDKYEGNGYKFSTQYYPNFEKLCKMELERLDKKLELEKKMNMTFVKTEESKPSEKEAAKTPYIWNFDNNDLIELVTAIFMVNAVKREDRKKITQTELTDFFEELFNLEVKNDKGTRAYISDPLTTRPLFLEKLKKGFIQYCDSKTEKKPEIIKTRHIG
jgi:hypothetical protein